MCDFTLEDLERLKPIGPKPEVRPGQLWRWNFSLGDAVTGSSTWFLAAVTSQAKLDGTLRLVAIHRDETFVVVATDDEGPNQLTYDENGWITPRERYHIVMLRETLAWIKPSEFDVCSLMKEEL